MPHSHLMRKPWTSADPFKKFPEKEEADYYVDPKTKKKKGKALIGVPAAAGDEKELLVSIDVRGRRSPNVLANSCGECADVRAANSGGRREEEDDPSPHY